MIGNKVEIFDEIVKTRSLTVIHYLVDEFVVSPGHDLISSEGKTALREISATNDLDEIYAIAHDVMGCPEVAKELRAWIAKKKDRK